MGCQLQLSMICDFLTVQAVTRHSCNAKQFGSSSQPKLHKLRQQSLNCGFGSRASNANCISRVERFWRMSSRDIPWHRLNSTHGKWCWFSKYTSIYKRDSMSSLRDQLLPLQMCIEQNIKLPRQRQSYWSCLCLWGGFDDKYLKESPKSIKWIFLEQLSGPSKMF